MLNQFKSFVENNFSLSPDQTVLIATSGGMDSVALSHLFKQASLPFAIAHCNFQLRGQASDADEAFVRQLASQLQVPYHVATFPTTQIAKTKGQSIQVAARQLRYQWLEACREQNAYSHIATAHHLDDAIETLLYNFAKGCGIRGLHGIPLHNGQIIRPLMFCGRATIAEYVQEQRINYREDASNASDKYDRNKIRHHIIPVLQEINPALTSTSEESLRHLREAEQIYDMAIEQWRKKMMEKKEGLIEISLKPLQGIVPQRSILYELIRPFGFNGTHARQMLEQQHQSGIHFQSATHQAIINREHLIIRPLRQEFPPKQAIYINQEDQKVSFDQDLELHLSISLPPDQFPNDPNKAFLDLDRLQFPLLLRPWAAGDRFRPLGMNGQHQKLQDFLTNQKRSVFEKEKVWVLESAGQICCVPGHRIDEGFKLGPDSKNCLMISLAYVTRN